jgi:hypothetical protein
MEHSRPRNNRNVRCADDSGAEPRPDEYHYYVACTIWEREGGTPLADISVPSNANIDRLNEIVVGWYRSKAHEAPVSISEVNKRIGIDETTISRQNADPRWRRICEIHGLWAIGGGQESPAEDLH